MSNNNALISRIGKKVIKITALLSVLFIVLAACSAAAGSSGGDDNGPGGGVLPAISLTPASQIIDVGENAVIIVAAASAPSESVTITVAVSGGTATVDDQEVMLTNGDFSQEATFSGLAAGTTYTLSATAAPTGIVNITGASATITVNNPSRPTVMVSSPTVTLDSTATVTVSTDPAPAGNVTVTVSATPSGGGTAVTKTAALTASDSDIDVMFPTGASNDLPTAGTYNLSVSVADADEAARVTVPSGNIGTITVNASDEVPTLMLTPPTQSIAIGGTAMVTVSTVPAPTSSVTVTVSATPSGGGTAVTKTAALTTSDNDIDVMFTTGTGNDLPTAGIYNLSVSVADADERALVTIPSRTIATINVVPVGTPGTPVVANELLPANGIGNADHIAGYNLTVDVSGDAFNDSDVITLRVGTTQLTDITPMSQMVSDATNGILTFAVAGESTQLGSAQTYSIVARATSLTTTDSTALMLEVTLDVDEDNDGLIELATQAMLANMNNDLSGRSYNSTTVAGGGRTAGCSTTCNGYELVRDVMDLGEWTPIGNKIQHTDGGDTITSFSAIFNGNGNEITGMTITNPTPTSGAGTRKSLGFFGYIGLGSVVTDIRVAGTIADTNTASLLSYGGLVGESRGGVIRNSGAAVTITAAGSNALVGGLVGSHQLGSATANPGTIENSYASGNVSASGTTANIGGLVGHNVGNIRNTYSSGIVTATGADSRAGSLVGRLQLGETYKIEYSYAGNSNADLFLYRVQSGNINPTDETTASYHYNGNTDDGGIAFAGDTRRSLAMQLQMPTAPGAMSTVGGTMVTTYEGWSTDNWDFGSSSQLPALKHSVDGTLLPGQR